MRLPKTLRRIVPEKIEPTGRNHDFTQPRWGHSFEVCEFVTDDIANAVTWSTPRVAKGDTITLSLESGAITRCMVTKAEPAPTVRDMAFITVKMIGVE